MNQGIQWNAVQTGQRTRCPQSTGEDLVGHFGMQGDHSQFIENGDPVIFIDRPLAGIRRVNPDDLGDGAEHVGELAVCVFCRGTVQQNQPGFFTRQRVLDRQRGRPATQYCGRQLYFSRGRLIG